MNIHEIDRREEKKKARRRGEFVDYTKQEALARAGNQCENIINGQRCTTKGKPDNPLVLHHRLPIDVIKTTYRELYNHPRGKDAISHPINIQVLCKNCHTRKHKGSETIEEAIEKEELYNSLAQYLMSIAVKTERNRIEKLRQRGVSRQ